MSEQPEPTEQFFPIETLNKLNKGKLEMDLGQLFKPGMKFRKENVLFEVNSISNKKMAVSIKVCGVFGSVATEPTVENN